MQYIILDGKKPTHGFKDGNGAKSWDDVKDFDNVAAIVPAGIIVLDFDTASDADLMLNICNKLSLKTRVIKTTRGIHCWFKSSEEHPKNFIKNRLAIGLYCDRKAGGRNAYVKIKDSGQMRDVLIDCKLDDLQPAPRWLASVSAPSDKFKFKHMSDGSGRNQELFNYVVYLQTKGFTRDEIRETIKIINTYVFEQPLPDAEIDLILRDDAFKPDDEIAAQIEESKSKLDGFKHNEFGDRLIDVYNIITVNSQIYVYEDGYYQQDSMIVEKKMIELFPAIKVNQRNEVIKYIKIQTHINAADLNVDPYVINLKNTRLNVKTGGCLAFTPEAIEFDRIPVTYDPSAYCADVDKTLNRVFCGDREIINLFEEMIGACLLKRTVYGKAFIMYGSGANGKSTVLDMLKKFIGLRNYSAIPLERLCDKFAVAELENKLANVGEDIDNVIIKDSGTLKRIFDGNSTQVERKGERPFTLEPYATHIFAANAIPHSYDKSDGFYRRWCIIPFAAKFTPTDPDYDPTLIDKLVTDTARSYLLNVGLRGVKRLLQQGHFTEPAAVAQLLKQYQIDNSSVLSWIEDIQQDDEYYLEHTGKELYLSYCDWCKNSGILKVTKNLTFYKELAKARGYDEKLKQKSNGGRYFVVAI